MKEKRKVVKTSQWMWLIEQEEQLLAELREDRTKIIQWEDAFIKAKEDLIASMKDFVNGEAKG